MQQPWRNKVLGMNWPSLEKCPSKKKKERKKVLEIIASFMDKRRDITGNFGLCFSIILLHFGNNTIIFEQHLEGREGRI